MLFRRLRPAKYAMVFLNMLLMEERCDVSGRYAATDPDLIDPQFLNVPRCQGMRSGTSDGLVLASSSISRPGCVRGLNARLFEAFIVGVFLS
jgi:hypothetical protein